MPGSSSANAFGDNVSPRPPPIGSSIAMELPQQFRDALTDLQSADHEVAKNALDRLWNFFVRSQQPPLGSTVLDFAYQCLPVFLQLLESSAFSHRRELAELTAILLIDLAHDTGQLSWAHKKLFPKSKTIVPFVERGWDHVHDRAPIFVEFMMDRTYEHRWLAALALGACRNRDVIPRLRELLRSETDAVLLAAILFALGELQAADAEDDVVPFLQSDNSLLKYMAGLALARTGGPAAEQGLTTLVDLLLSTDWDTMPPEWDGLESIWIAYTPAYWLYVLGRTNVAVAVEELIERLPDVQPVSAFVAAKTLFELVFPIAWRRKLPRHAELTDLQLRILRSIADSAGFWTYEGDREHCEILDRHGIPKKRAELLSYLQEE